MLQQESEILAHRRRFLEKPRDVECAKEYWQALGRIQGCDIRSGRYVAEAFGPAALSSVEGAVAFACAYQELFELTGEAPKTEYVDAELRHALAKAMASAAPEDADIICWVLHSSSKKQKFDL